MNSEVPLVYPILIAIVLPVLAGLTWGIYKNQPDAGNEINLFLSKCCEKQITVELEFHGHLGLFTPAASTGFTETAYSDDQIRKYAGHYVEERSRLLEHNREIIRLTNAMATYRVYLVLNLLLYAIAAIVILFLDYNKLLNAMWIYLIVWIGPFAILLGIYAHIIATNKRLRHLGLELGSLT